MRRFVSFVVAVVLLFCVGACGPVQSAEPAAPSSSPSASASEAVRPRRVVRPRVAERRAQPVEVEEPQTVEPDYEALARRVVAGEFGNGEARREALGADYERVQEIVNGMVPQAAPVQSAPVQSQPSQPSAPVVQEAAPPAVASVQSDPVEPVEPEDAPEDVVQEFSADPEGSWDSWRTEFGSDADVDVPLSQVPVCAALDGSTGTGYEKVCQATSEDGLHYVLVGGTAMEVWR